MKEITHIGIPKITEPCNPKCSSKFVREYRVLHSTLRNLMPMIIKKVVSLYKPINFLAILYSSESGG